VYDFMIITDHVALFLGMSHQALAHLFLHFFFSVAVVAYTHTHTHTHSNTKMSSAHVKASEQISPWNTGSDTFTSSYHSNRIDVLWAKH